MSQSKRKKKEKKTALKSKVKFQDDNEISFAQDAA